jgi:hypothetical protein
MRTEESIKHTIMGIVASTVKLPSGDGEAIAERIIEMLTEEGNLIIPHVSVPFCKCNCQGSESDCSNER